jgi:hypothetical protein
MPLLYWWMKLLDKCDDQWLNTWCGHEFVMNIHVKYGIQKLNSIFKIKLGALTSILKTQILTLKHNLQWQPITWGFKSTLS